MTGAHVVLGGFTDSLQECSSDADHRESRRDLGGIAGGQAKGHAPRTGRLDDPEVFA
jgi:hypothetical protein